MKKRNRVDIEIFVSCENAKNIDLPVLYLIKLVQHFFHLIFCEDLRNNKQYDKLHFLGRIAMNSNKRWKILRKSHK